MYCIENGFYHMQQGFNDTKPDNANFPAEYCEYYRITPEQFTKLNESKNTVQFATKLIALGILDQWKVEADKAIAELERLTGQKFIVDSTSTQFNAPRPEEIEEEEKRQKEGYYTPEAEQLRADGKKQSILDELAADRDKEIAKHIVEYETKKEIFLKGGEKALNNCIFYNHTKEVAFNWKSYDMLPESFVADLISKLQLPEGVKAKDSKGK